MVIKVIIVIMIMVMIMVVIMIIVTCTGRLLGDYRHLGGPFKFHISLKTKSVGPIDLYYT